MIKVMFQGRRGLNILITMLFPKGSFKETLVTRIHISRNRWKRISSSDLSSSWKLGGSSKDSQSTYQTFMTKGMPKEEIRLHYLTTRSCRKEISRGIPVTMIHISKKRWRRINSSDLNNSWRWEESSRESPNIYQIFTTKEMPKGEIKLLFRITRSCLREDSKEIQAIKIPTSKKRWRKISNFDLNNSSK